VPSDSVSLTDYYKQNVYDTSDNSVGEISDKLTMKGAALSCASEPSRSVTLHTVMHCV
jgi:hypothetical protein